MYRLLSAGCKYSPHPYSLPFTLFLVLAVAAVPGHAQAQQNKRVWTTTDVNELRSQGLISIIGAEEEAVAPAAAPAAPAETAEAQQGPIYNSRFEDPEWYAEQAAALQAQLDASKAALLQAQDNLAAVRDLRSTIGGVDLNADNPGVTPDAGIANLEDQVRDLQNQLDDLADAARENDIEPGVVRAAS